MISYIILSMAILIKELVVNKVLAFIELINQYMRGMQTQFVFQLVNSFRIYIPTQRLWVWAGDGNPKESAIRYQVVPRNSVHASFLLLISMDIR